MKIIGIIVLVVIALFILLPILHGDAPLPEDMSASAIGQFIGGFLKYWFEALLSAFGAE